MNNTSRIFEKPVAWLFGHQFIGTLKGLLLYTAHGEKLDPRDWMTGEAFSFDDPSRSEQPEFWFDYLSDAGDGNKAMYSLAYLTMARSLWTKLDSNTTQLPTDPLKHEVRTTGDGAGFQLPRGEFLFLGGDTAYHSADYLTLLNRIQRPFSYAYLDLVQNNLISDNDPRRPIFAIPGNHDYYDQVDGFRRQFRKPIRPEGPLPPGRSGPTNAQLTIAGFKRVQEASYVSLQLPWDWWFWGLDIEPGVLDRRQRKFFRSYRGEDQEFTAPKKLIVATCAPSTVFGHLATDEDKLSKSLRFLGVKRPFVPNPSFDTAGDHRFKPGQCRLDLSGDVHHYARYWGPKPADGTSPRAKSTAPQPSSESYASVVSGAGGAFHHPTTTFDNQITEQVLYPPEPESRGAVANKIFNFWTVMSGGYVWLAGLILGFTIYFGMVGPQSSRQFVSNIGVLNRLGLVSPEQITPTVISPGRSQPCDPVKPFALWTKLGVAPETWTPPSTCTATNSFYFFTSERKWPLDFILGQIFLFLSLVAIVITFTLSVFTQKIFDDKNEFEEGIDPNRKLWPIIIGTAALVIVGFSSMCAYRNYITPFNSSLLVLYSIFAAVTAIVLSIRYSEYSFKKSFVTGKRGDWVLQWACWVIAVIVVACGLWFFGQNNLPALVISDIFFAIVLIAAVVGIMLLPFKVAEHIFSTKPKWVQIVGKTLIGLWHLVLQLCVPFLLIKTGNYITWAIAAVLLFLPIPLASALMKRNSRVGLTLLWVAYGALMLAVPLVIFLRVDPDPFFFYWTGWVGLVPALLAGAVGAVTCCLWTGWYFGVCFIFNGHNNEVGGAARIENFKQFIRFRLTPDTLTGYVIAVDDVSIIGTVDDKGRTRDGSDLRPKLIDVFHLTCK